MLTIKKSTALFFLLAVTCITSLLVGSCNNNNLKGTDKNRVVIDIPQDGSGLDKIDHFISEDSIKLYRSSFERQAGRFEQVQVHVPTSEAFNKRALLSLLKANDCVGIRIYYGAKSASNNRSELRLILVGVDSKGKDILIDRTSALAAKLTQSMGGEENGQCPNCLN